MPISILEKEKCYGCGVCSKVCPVQCVSIEQNSEGFRYPHVNEQECINCDKCNQVCPGLHDFPRDTVSVPKAYIGVHRDKDTLVRSSSGGAFTAITDAVLGESRRIYVFGACQDENLRTFHSLSHYPDEDIEKFRKSKYVQSNLDNTVETCGKLLKAGEKVLFSGTPCQVYALYRYLDCVGIDTKNLTTIDLVCFGVSSDKILSMCLAKQQYSGVVRCDMRYKQKYWGRISSKYTKFEFASNRKPIIARKSQFKTAYVKGIILRESCIACGFSNTHRCSDFTIGDGWHADEMEISTDTSWGCSLLLCHTQKANDLLMSIKKHMDVEEVSIDTVISSQKRLQGYNPDINERKRFLQAVRDNGFNKAMDEYVKMDNKIVECISGCISPRIKKQIIRLIKRR